MFLAAAAAIVGFTGWFALKGLGETDGWRSKAALISGTRFKGDLLFWSRATDALNQFEFLLSFMQIKGSKQHLLLRRNFKETAPILVFFTQGDFKDLLCLTQNAAACEVVIDLDKLVLVENSLLFPRDSMLIGSLSRSLAANGGWNFE